MGKVWMDFWGEVRIIYLMCWWWFPFGYKLALDLAVLPSAKFPDHRLIVTPCSPRRRSMPLLVTLGRRHALGLPPSEMVIGRHAPCTTWRQWRGAAAIWATRHLH